MFDMKSFIWLIEVLFQNVMKKNQIFFG